MFCPMTMNSSTWKDCPCSKEACVWYNQERGMCHIVVLAEAMMKMAAPPAVVEKPKSPPKTTSKPKTTDDTG